MFFFAGIMDMFEPSPRPPTRTPARRIAMLAAAQEVAQATEDLAGSIVESVLHPRAVHPPTRPVMPESLQAPTPPPLPATTDTSSSVVVHFVAPSASSIPEVILSFQYFQAEPF